MFLLSFKFHFADLRVAAECGQMKRFPLNKKSLRAGTKLLSRYHPASHHTDEQLMEAITGLTVCG